MTGEEVWRRPCAAGAAGATGAAGLVVGSRRGLGGAVETGACRDGALVQPASNEQNTSFRNIVSKIGPKAHVHNAAEAAEDRKLNRT